MKDNADVSRGVAVVALMALSQRGFFEHLLENPRSALAGVRVELNLGHEDVEEVTRLIEETRGRMSPEDALRLWDDWRETGIWGGGPGGWVGRGWIGL